MKGMKNQDGYEHKRAIKQTVWIVVLLLILGVATGTGVFFLTQNKESSMEATKQQEEKEKEQVEDTTVLSHTKVLKDVKTDDTVVTVATKVMPSIVSIQSTVSVDFNGQRYEEVGAGSGIIVKKTEKELLIVTNNHVVENAKKIGVAFLDGEQVAATVKGTDRISDLAVISLNLSDMKQSTLKEIKVATLGDSSSVKVGERAIAIGNALGYGQSVTVGYISAKDRAVMVETENNPSKMVLLQTDAAINPGNSGGALLNTKGEVIGINTIKFASETVEGMGYAIPITTAIPIINDLMDREVLKNEEKGYLGISGSDISEAESKQFNIPLGVLVSEVSKDGAAYEAGVKPQDIITKINGMDVTSITALAERVNSYRVGTKITLTVMRFEDGDYVKHELEVSLKGKETLDSIQTEPEKKEDENGSIPEKETDPFADFPWEFFR